MEQVHFGICELGQLYHDTSASEVTLKYMG